MKKRAVIIMRYENEKELTKFLAANGNAVAEVSAVYENLDAADVEQLEEFLEENILPALEEK